MPRLLSVLILMVAMTGGAQGAGEDVLPLVPGAHEAAAGFTILDRQADGLTVRLDLQGIARERITMDGRAFDRLGLPDGGFAGAEGQAGLPTITRLVALPAGSGVEVRLVDRDTQTLKGLAPAPVLPVLDRNEAAPSFDAAAYAATPAGVIGVTVGEPALLRGLRVVPVTFAPVAYDPARGEVTAAVRMTVEIAFTGRDTRNDPAGPARLIPESFATLYEQTVLGYERGDDVASGPGSAIYVCPNNASVLEMIEDLAEWRRHQGYHVEVVNMGLVGGTNNAIRTYLMNRYAALDPPLEFVTLVGDANGAIAVPTFNETTSGYYGEGDHNYSRLDGEDVLADVHVGRISVQSTSQLRLAIDKIIDYESDPDFSDTDWFTTAGLTGDPSTSGYSCIFTNQFVKNQLLELGFTQVDTIWTPSYLTKMMATINQGETVFTYRGLGGMSGMSYSHIQATTNGRQLPFAIILTCDTGSFQDDTTARSEAFLRAANGGGIGAIGTATSGTHTRYNNCMFLGITDHLLTSGDFRFGPALTRGKMNFYINFWQNEQNKVWTWSTWNNLMGDPATELWTGVPAALDVSHADQVALTAGALPVTVTSGGAPVADARVAVYQAGNLRSVARTDQAGQAVLDIAQAAGGDIHVTVTGHDLYPYRGLVARGTVARSLDLTQFTLADGADGQANPGEALDLTVQLTNGGTNAVSGATAALAAGPDWLTLDPDPVDFGTVPAGGTAWAQQPWQVTLAADAPGGETAVVELVASGGGETWTSLLSLPVHGPRGDLAGATWSHPGGSPDPGESGALIFELGNVGDLGTAGVTGRLTCDSQWVDVTDGDGAWGAVTVGGSSLPSDAFGVSFPDVGYPGHLAGFTLELTFAEGGTQVLEFQTTVGTATAGDPTGPDPYGYYAFSNDDTDPLAPTYDWVELALLGEDTGISDTYRWDDETRTIDLPFPFTYYGEEYNRVSICSNGWLAFGDTYLKFYRPWMLPADGSPDAMVCAFWDDLAGGQVLTWHDEANHRFIVQWDNFSTWYEAYPDGYYSGNCTFEIILTDPAHAGTDTGDGLIEIQYQSVTVSADETTYFGVGIQDRTRTRGLTYAYGNHDAGGAATIQPGRAIAWRPIVPQVQGTLQGTVRNASAGGSPIPGASITVLDANRTIMSAPDGRFEGSVPAGSWDVAVSHPSCAPDTARGVVVVEGQATVQDFDLLDIGGPTIAGTTQLSGTTDTVGPYVIEATVSDLSGVAEYHLYYTSSSSGGPFQAPLALVDAESGLVRGEIPGQPLGTRVQYWLTARDVLGNASADPVGAPWPCYAFQVAEVTTIVAQDFEASGGGFTVNAGGSDTATSGIWTRADPVGTENDGQPVQPEDDHTAAPGVYCWITGQHPSGGSVGDNDVDGGVTSLYSPTWNLAGYSSVTLSYWRWYTNDQGSSPNEDVWQVQISNDGGASWTDVENTQFSNNAWQQVQVALEDHFATPDQLRLRFLASDLGSGSLVEAAVDDLRLEATALAADQDPPTVTVTAPATGAQLASGQTMNVGWNAADDTGVVHARIWLSLDAGENYELLLAEGPLDGALAWTVDVPGGPANYSCRVRVEVLDAVERLASDESGVFTIVPGTVDIPTAGPRLALGQNQPNPFNPQTVIVFSLPRAQDATLRIYDVQGRLVRTLVQGPQQAGRREAVWQGRDDQGGEVASGMYFYRLTTEDGSLVRKMLLLK